MPKFPDSENDSAFEPYHDSDQEEGRPPAASSGMSTFEAPGTRFKAPKVDATAGRSAPYNWSILTVAELVRFRDEITRALPALQLSVLNLEEEMLVQYHTLRELQASVMDEKEVPANQRAQVANTVAATLRSLGDMQIDLYSSERFKDIENLMIRTLTRLPEDLAAEFIAEYEKLIKIHDGKSQK